MEVYLVWVLYNFTEISFNNTSVIIEQFSSKQMTGKQTDKRNKTSFSFWYILYINNYGFCYEHITQLRGLHVF